MTHRLRAVDLSLLLGFLKSDGGSCLLFFLIGLTLRGIPELLVSWYPVGYEVIAWYVPPMMGFVGRSSVTVFAEFFGSGPLFYTLMWLVLNLTGVHPFVVLKVVGPLFYGGLIVSFFVFLRRGLKFEWRMAFVASLLLAFQIAALRDSWDRFRTVLGLGFLFAALTALRVDHKYRWGLVSVFAVLAVLSREYVALVLFVTVLGFAVLEKRDRVASLVALGPAVSVFAVMVFPGLLGLVWGSVPEGVYGAGGYVWVVQDAFVIFLVCYVGLLPFVLRGLFRDKIVGLMAGLLLVFSFSVVGPWFAVPGYQRWLMLLVFPFTVYAVKGFERFGFFVGRRVVFLVTILLGFMFVGVGYSTGGFSYVGRLTNSYVAVSMVESSIGWGRVDDVRAVLGWLDVNAEFNSSVLAEECFYGWTLLYFGRASADVRVIPYGAASSPVSVLPVVLRGGFSRVYLIWYTDQVFAGFSVVYSWNDVSVFEYVPQLNAVGGSV